MPEPKSLAAEAALEYVRGHPLLGVGTGTTVDAFIDALARCASDLHAAVPSSERTAARLRAAGIAVLDPAEVDALPVYVDGADEVDSALRLIKGGGGAATREKLLATASDVFVCIADESKIVERLGATPVPVEVLGVAERFVERRLLELGGRPMRRRGFETDDGNLILDVIGLPVAEGAAEMELALDAVPGIVGHGLFATRQADVLLVGEANGTVRAVTRAIGDSR